MANVLCLAPEICQISTESVQNGKVLLNVWDHKLVILLWNKLPVHSYSQESFAVRIVYLNESQGIKAHASYSYHCVILSVQLL